MSRHTCACESESGGYTGPFSLVVLHTCVCESNPQVSQRQDGCPATPQTPALWTLIVPGKTGRGLPETAQRWGPPIRAPPGSSSPTPLSLARAASGAGAALNRPARRSRARRRTVGVASQLAPVFACVCLRVRAYVRSCIFYIVGTK